MAQRVQIPDSEIDYDKFSIGDRFGRVFRWQGRIMRAIQPQSVPAARALFTSGLLNELEDAGLIPHTSETNYTVQPGDIIWEHERVPIVIYPYEWSFSMLKDAALTVLKINRIAEKYGYETKDCHGYNILFYHAQPLFVDIGSFVRRQPGNSGWSAYAEFVQFYEYSLRMWSDGNEYIARSALLFATGGAMPPHSYLLYRHPLIRKLSPSLQVTLGKLPISAVYIGNRTTGDIEQHFSGRRRRLLLFAKRIGAFKPFRLQWQHLEQRIERIQLKQPPTQWANYHSALQKENGSGPRTYRFEHILQIIRERQIKSVVELGGNQGLFSRMMLQSAGVEEVICTDYDHPAIETLYSYLKTDHHAITPAIIDFTRPYVSSLGEPPQKRFRCDAVLALAVTHHLLLSQNRSVDHILETITSYCNRYVFVEFMPLGLWDGHSAPPIPEWYTVDWFRNACETHFTILHEEQLEENRILFFGQAKAKID